MAKLTFLESSAPSTPSSGYVELYAKSDGRFYSKDDTGTERAISISSLTLGTEQASTSGTSITFSSIPAGVHRITVMFAAVSTSGTSNIMIQLGDAGGLETTGYLSGASSGQQSQAWVTTAATTGFLVTAGTVAAGSYHGSITFTLEDSSGFTWVSQGMLWNSTATVLMHPSAGSKSLSAELTQLAITTVGGSDTFDAGVMNIMYEGNT